MEFQETEPKIYLPREMVQSPAFRKLNRTELFCLLDFYSKRIMKKTGRHSGNGRSPSGKVWIIENNGNIQFPYSEANAMGYSPDQFRNAIDGLQKKGFIDITHLGKGGRKPAKGQGDATKYLIDDRWREFENGRAVKPPKKPRKPDNRKGRGWGLYWQDVFGAAFMLYVQERTKQVRATIGDELRETGQNLERVVERIREKWRLKKQTFAMEKHSGSTMENHSS